MIVFPAAVIAELRKPNRRYVKRAQLIRDYWNADTRLVVDVSDDVQRWAKLSGESTIKSVSWKVGSLTISMKNENGRYSPEHPSSVWRATFDRTPRECALIFRLLLPMPDGTLYELHTYKGGIEDAVPREQSNLATVELVTKHLSHRPLTAKITKSSGDEAVVIGTGW